MREFHTLTHESSSNPDIPKHFVVNHACLRIQLLWQSHKVITSYQPYKPRLPFPVRGPAVPRSRPGRGSMIVDV